MGTVSYMSPEQARAKAIDARSDIWSTGVMIYEMVAGRNLSADLPRRTIVEILEKEPAPLTKLGPEVPEELTRIVAKSIAKNPDERYQTAKDMLIDLRNLEAARTGCGDFAAPVVIGLRKSNRCLLSVRAGTRHSRVVRGHLIRCVAPAQLRPLFTGRKLSSRPRRPVKRTLTYWITVQKFKDGRPF